MAKKGQRANKAPFFPPICSFSTKQTVYLSLCWDLLFSDGDTAAAAAFDESFGAFFRKREKEKETDKEKSGLCYDDHAHFSFFLSLLFVADLGKSCGKFSLSLPREVDFVEKEKERRRNK